VVVLDDLHWAEPALLDLIEHIADFSRGAAILIVCLARPELVEDGRAWGSGQPHVTTLRLEPLEPADTAALIAELLPAGADTDLRLRGRVQSAAAGNPLFVEEMIALIGGSGGREVTVPPASRRCSPLGWISCSPGTVPCWSAGQWRGRRSTGAACR